MNVVSPGARCCHFSLRENDEAAARQQHPRPLLAAARTTTSRVESSNSSAENFVAQEMSALTVQERELLYEEIHGVAPDMMEETPEMVLAALQKMREEIAKTNKRKRKALDMALYLRPSLANDDNFQLMFLRAEQFQPVEAARKMIRHFNHKLVLFGEENLAKPITLEDLTPEEIQILQTSPPMLFPTINEKGIRAAYYMLSGMTAILEDWKLFTRVCWYQLMALLEDETVQKTGIVNISNSCGQIAFGKLMDVISKSASMCMDWPVRVRAYHVLCPQDSSIRPLMAMINKVAPKQLRIRERLHFGSSIELEYSLLSYGIRLRECYTLGKGMYSEKNLGFYIEDRRQKEDESRRREVAITDDGTLPNFTPYPLPDDILMGRGSPLASEWVGNARLNRIIETYVDRYEQLSGDRLEKTMIAIEIIQRIRESGKGRFLQRTSTGWERVDGMDQAPREKVSGLLRTAVRNKHSGKTKQLGGDSSGDDHSASASAKRIKMS